MLLVLFAHSLHVVIFSKTEAATFLFPSYKWVYSFHMPLFFLLSGMVHKNKKNIDAIQSAISLVSLALIVHTICWGIDYFTNQHPTSRHSLIRPFVMLMDFSSAIVWFLAALALCQLIYHFMTTTDRWSRTVLIIATAGAFIASQKTSTNNFEFGALFPALCFYAFGAKFPLHQFSKHRSFFGLAGSLCLLAICWPIAQANGGCSFDRAASCPSIPAGFAVWMVNGWYGYYPLFAAAAITGVAGTLFFAQQLAIKKTLSTRILQSIGQNSLNYFLANAFVFWLITPLFFDYAATSILHACSATAILMIINLACAQCNKPFFALQSISRRIAKLVTGWFMLMTKAVRGRRYF